MKRVILPGISIIVKGLLPKMYAVVFCKICYFHKLRQLKNLCCLDTNDNRRYCEKKNYRKTHFMNIKTKIVDHSLDYRKILYNQRFFQLNKSDFTLGKKWASTRYYNGHGKRNSVNLHYICINKVQKITH